MYNILMIIKEFFNGMKPDMMFIDIDGVMTETRDSYVLDLDVIRMLRDVEDLGLPICLASGNAYPVVLTLQRYLGFSPIFIAENGCVIHINKSYIKLCKDSLDHIAEEILKRFGLPKSDCNLYRFCDRAYSWHIYFIVFSRFVIVYGVYKWYYYFTTWFKWYSLEYRGRHIKCYVSHLLNISSNN